MAEKSYYSKVKESSVVDKENKILYLFSKSLNLHPMFELEYSKSAYDVKYRDLEYKVKKRVEVMVSKGYSVVFKHGGNSKILIYNG